MSTALLFSWFSWLSFSTIWWRSSDLLVFIGIWDCLRSSVIFIPCIGAFDFLQILQWILSHLVFQDAGVSITFAFLFSALIISWLLLLFPSVPRPRFTSLDSYLFSMVSFLAFPLYLRLDLCCNMLAVSFDMRFSFIRTGRLIEKKKYSVLSLIFSPIDR